MFEIGTSTHAIAGLGASGKSFRQGIGEIAECGYDHLMLLPSESGPPVDRAGDAPECRVDVKSSDLRAILRTISSHGLRTSCIYPGFRPDYSSEKISESVEGLKAYRDLGWVLGCHVMVHPAGKAEEPRTPLNRKREQIRCVAEVMDALASDAPGEIFKMAIDIHYGSLVETVADCEYLLEWAKEKNAGLCLNMGHMTTLGEEGWNLLLRFPERVHVIAWKDHLVGDNLPQPVVSVELGKGATPFQKYVDAFRQVDCGGLHLITFEAVPPEEKKDALRRSRDYLIKLFKG